MRPSHLRTTMLLAVVATNEKPHRRPVHHPDERAKRKTTGYGTAKVGNTSTNIVMVGSLGLRILMMEIEGACSGFTFYSCGRNWLHRPSTPCVWLWISLVTKEKSNRVDWMALASAWISSGSTVIQWSSTAGARAAAGTG